jgi:transcriptional regulator with XRE-family HTH domain
MSATRPTTHSQQLATLLKSSRKALGLTQAAAAERSGVSVRLWAEVERAERPNVSLETALRMLAEVGVTMRLSTADGIVASIRTSESDAATRAARAELRRQTWTGRKIRLMDDDDVTPMHNDPAEQISAVTRVSEQAFAIAAHGRSTTSDC